MKKGQSALEYLVTYGWAILAIVIVAAILWYFGVFNPSRFTSSHQCGGFSDFQCLDYNVSGSSAGIVLGNKLGTTLQSIIASVGDGSCTPSPASVGPNNQLTLTCTGIGSAQAGNTYNVSLTFTDAQSGLTHSDSGFIGSS